MASAQHQTAIETIAQLADDIARTSPECADKAMRIVKLLADLDGARPDRATIQDAIEAETVSDLSDGQVRRTADAVVRTLREEP